MRVARVLALAMASVLLAAGAGAQARTQPLEHGLLVVWWVVPANATEKAIQANRKLSAEVLPPRVSVEKTTGEFGTASSNVGQTAGSYGQTSGSTGTASSNVGQTAGSVGQTAGSLGQTAGSYGQTSSSVGQTAASYGQVSSSYGQSIEGQTNGQSNVPALPGQGVATTRSLSIQERRLVDAVKSSFPRLETRFVTVLDIDLKERLEKAAGTGEAPDVVFGTEKLRWWKESQLGLTMLGLPFVLEQMDTTEDSEPQHEARFVTILRGAPHMAQAKAFVVWVRDERTCGACSEPPLAVPGEVLSVARGAVQRVLSGGGLGGDADPAAAKFDEARAQWVALAAAAGIAPSQMEATELDVEPMSAIVSGPLAVVSVRSVASGPHSFGVVHTLVVLRQADGEPWKVLQVSVNLWPPQLTLAGRALGKAISGRKGDVALQGVSVAAPVDGDNRQATPELWWDNKGGATLEAVEWQMRAAGAWSSSSLELIEDTNSRLHTRVSAKFATLPMVYRWRVWAVAAGGQAQLSEWRTFTVVGR